MAGIREYTNPIEGFTLSDRSSESAVRAGREVDANAQTVAGAYRALGGIADSTINTVGDVAVKHMQAKEINNGAPAFTGLYIAMEKDWNERLKNSPDDPNLQSKFLQDHEERLQKFKDSFFTEGGRNWAESRIDSLRQHMAVKTTADSASATSDQIGVKLDQTVNSLSSMTRTDPASIKFNIENYSKTVDALVDNSGLTGTQASKVKEQLRQAGLEKIVKSGVWGAIAKNPTEGLKLLEDPEIMKYVNGVEAKTFAKQAEVLNRQSATLQRQIDAQVQKDQANEFSKKLTSAVLKNPQGTLPRNYYQVLAEGAAALPGMTDENMRSLATFGDTWQRKDQIVNPDNATIESLNRRIGLPKTDPDFPTIYELAGHFGRGAMTKEQFTTYKSVVEASDPQLNAANSAFAKVMESMKSAVTGANAAGIKYPDLEIRFGQFEMEARRRFNLAYSQGGYKAAMATLNVGPAGGAVNPDYVGNLLPSYIPTSGKGMNFEGFQNFIRTGQPTVSTPPRLPPDPDFSASFDARFRGTSTVTQPAQKPGSVNLGDSTITGISVTPEPIKPPPKRNPGESTEDYLRRREGR
jgi:hypothetical protein